MQLEDWLDDLCVRFIINIPQEELVELERICFQIEEAQWFYEDFIRPLDPKLPSLGLKPFFQRIIQRCPVFRDRPHEDWASAYDRFILYKNRVPVRGAILLNDQMDQILLVKGWKKHATWSFPRGKINKDEADIDCAIREAWEETGFDIKSAGLVKDPRKIRHIEKTLRDQSVKLFIFRGVPTDYNFIPQTRKEISKCEWYKIADLPTSVKAKLVHQEGTGQHLVLNANKFYMVAPFVQELKKVIAQFRKSEQRQSSKLAAPPTNVEQVAFTYPEENINLAALDPPLLSPAIPSTLPEVTPISTQDQSFRFEKQLDMQQAGYLDNSNTVMSNALLNLLRGTPATEMGIDPPTPMEQGPFNAESMSPERPLRTTEANVQSPPAVLEVPPGKISSEVPSAAFTPLNQHAKSLLETLNQPKVQSPALEARQQLPPSKQDLLAAFMSKQRTSSTVQPNQLPPSNHGNDLLQMLQRTRNTSEAATQTAIADSAERSLSVGTRDVAITSSPSVPSQGISNPLLDLLKGGRTTTSSSTRLTASESVVPETPKQPVPVELSATSDHEDKVAPVDTVKANILSMLGAKPQKSPHTIQKDKNRKGSLAATLSGPIMQPQFDAIKAPVSEDDLKRPIASQKKLFDPKTDELKPTPTKPLSRHDDRNRQAKSQQRTPKPQKNHNAGARTVQKEPKEVSKPFQPQILRRPQNAEGETSIFGESPRATVTPEGLTATMTTQSPDQEFNSTAMASMRATAPLPVSQDAQILPPTPMTSAAAMLSPIPKQMPTVPQDPQREALLSLLRTPSQSQPQLQQKQTPVPIDDESTPRPALPSPAILDTQSVIPPVGFSASPPSLSFAPSQIVSPVNEADPYASRSRVSSLASIGNGFVAGSRQGSGNSSRPPVEKRQTAAGDKAFLMSYLRGFASQGQETT